MSKHSDIERDIIALLTECGWFAWPSHSPTARPAHPGIPDILAVKGGRLLCVEIKVPPDKLSSTQVDVIECLHHHGARVIVARGVKDVEEAARR